MRLRIKTVCLFVTLFFIGLTTTGTTFASTLQWTQRESMLTARSSLGAVATNNGRIYAIGGIDYNGTVFAVNEEYDIATNTWTTKSNMPTPRFGIGVALGSNNKIYVIGGETGNFQFSNKVEEYDPSTDAWITKADMPTPRMDLEMAAINDGKIYAIGGCCPQSGGYYTTVEEYDMATDTWVTKSSIPEGTSAGRGAVYANNGKIYIFGPPNTGKVQVYNPSSDTWSTAASMLSMRWYMGNTLGPDEKIYTIGGYTDLRPDNPFFGALDTVEEYDPSTNAWNTNTPLPTSRFNLAAVTGSDGAIYAIGGDSYTSTAGGGQVLAAVESAVVSLSNQPPTIDSLSNATINEGGTYSASGSFTDPDSTSWTATVDYEDGSGMQTLTLSGTNFSLNHLYKDNGIYTVTVSVTDNEKITGTSSATVTVNNVSPSVGAITVSPSPTHINEPVTASANFTDQGVLDTHTATWDWGDGSAEQNGSVTESDGSGSVSNTHTYADFGTYAISLTVVDNDNASGDNSTSVTVIKQITVLNPAEVWLSKGLLNIGVRFDVLAEAYKDNTLVSSGQLDSVRVGSGRFITARLVSIPFNSFSPVDFPSGSQLKIKVSARNACSGSLRDLATARLWFNDSHANSHFGATIGTTNNSYYLLNKFLLSTTIGEGPRQYIDIDAGTRCSAFKPFGTWTITP